MLRLFRIPLCMLLCCLVLTLAVSPAVVLADDGDQTASSQKDPAAQKADDDAQKKAEEEKKKKEDATKPVVDPWADIWEGQRDYLVSVIKEAKEKNTQFSGRVTSLSPAEENEARRLLVLANNFRKWPNPLEAVSRRISLTIRRVDQLLQTPLQERAMIQAMLERVRGLSSSLPDDTQSAGQEIKNYAKDIRVARSRLENLLRRYDTALAPAQNLLRDLSTTQKEISALLPGLWKEYYLHGAVPYLSPDTWKRVLRQLQYFTQGLILRVPVEIPITPEQWESVFLRLGASVAFSLLILFLLYRNCRGCRDNMTLRHIFRVSLPWLFLGLCLISASIASSDETFRLFLALGNLNLIVAQVFLAWDLRRLRHTEVPAESSPLWRLIPLTVMAYILLYLPLPAAIGVVTWIISIIAYMVVQRKRRFDTNFGPMQLETSICSGLPAVIWIVLILALMGLHVYSMVLYLLYASVSLALQLSMGSMSLINRINDRLPKDGGRAALSSVLVALAAPTVIILACGSIAMWVITLPGGGYLLQDYVLKGVDVGATRFNALQVLLIVSMFFITRTAVRMGCRFISHLPERGLSIEGSLIQPMQTAVTYTFWALFGMFVLRALGMELSNLAMIAGGLSVGIGFGMQTIINNFLSGLILIFSRTMQEGDVVEVGNTTGRVRKISVRATVVETYDNAIIYVPNSEFVSSRLINWTRNSRSVRLQVDVGVAYGTDTALVMRLMHDIAGRHPRILKHPEPIVLFTAFGDSTLNFALRFWVQDYDVGVSTSSDLRLIMEREFRAHNIEVAFPQLDVHIKQMPPRAITPRDMPPRSEPRAPQIRRPRPKVMRHPRRDAAQTKGGANDPS